MNERIQKIISAAGITSRRAAEQMILQGRVTCNGQVVQLGQQADPGRDEILVDGKPLARQEQLLYILLHKPRGYVTTLSDERGRKTVAELVSGCGQRVYPVGRLDMDSEGLLILTNDGDFANMLMHPRHEIRKVYDVLVSGYWEGALELLRRPVELDGYRIRPPQAELLRSKADQAVLRVTICEGRNRQVRRMCQLAGLQVQRLRRVQEGILHLGDLPEGTWRHLTAEEVRTLQKESV